MGKTSRLMFFFSEDDSKTFLILLLLQNHKHFFQLGSHIICFEKIKNINIEHLALEIMDRTFALSNEVYL